jgi:hypothetical protein
VFQADVRTNDVFELFSVPVDDSASPVLVSRKLVAGGSIASYQVSADGRVVVYGADRSVDERFELFRAPITGGPSERVSGELVAGGDVTAFALGRAGRVFYLADQETDGVVELHASVPRARTGDGPAGTVMR